MAEILFKIAAGVLALAAAYCMWQGWPETAFIVAVFGCVAFFFSVRVQTKNRIRQRETEAFSESEEDQAR